MEFLKTRNRHNKQFIISTYYTNYYTYYDIIYIMYGSHGKTFLAFSARKVPDPVQYLYVFPPRFLVKGPGSKFVSCSSPIVKRHKYCH